MESNPGMIIFDIIISLIFLVILFKSMTASKRAESQAARAAELADLILKQFERAGAEQAARDAAELRLLREKLK